MQNVNRIKDALGRIDNRERIFCPVSDHSSSLNHMHWGSSPQSQHGWLPNAAVDRGHYCAIRILAIGMVAPFEMEEFKAGFLGGAALASFNLIDDLVNVYRWRCVP
eukprot:4104799-Amphidinium_carterae.1